VGDGEGLGEGDGEGLGEGDGEGLGEGDGEGLGEGDGEGLGAGDGIEPFGYRSYPVRYGFAKPCDAVRARARIMKSCQISAGIVPPNTAGKPSTFTIDVVSFFGYPTHTQVASCGV
jgi:hypothetical protein